MNEDVFSGKWREMRGTLRSWWGRLTDDDLEKIGGEKDKLVGLVQERYGQTRDQAERERLKNHSPGNQRSPPDPIRQRPGPELARIAVPPVVAEWPDFSLAPAFRRDKRKGLGTG